VVKLNINGKTHEVDGDPDMPLLWVLRDRLGMTGTKYGCGIAACGACTVQADGQAQRSCQIRLEDAAAMKITTIEGARGKAAQAVQAAWRKMNVVQCGYCQSGQIMSAVALLTENKKPTDAQIDEAMNGNLCRCATYHRIRAAIHEAAKSMGA
jgi:isoquinoline 1-oxidoreductase alpha subunit